MNSSVLKCIRYLLPPLIGCFFLAACSEQRSVEIPPPFSLTRDDTGYFCGMIVEDHQGPKSQIVLQNEAQAIWFTTARDGVAFTRLPEEVRPVAVFYVSAIDLGGWDNPEADPANMIRADQAWFVIQSERLGSMGAPESIPFSSASAAHAFAEKYNGRVVSLGEIPDAYILGPEQPGEDIHAGHSM